MAAAIVAAIIATTALTACRADDPGGTPPGSPTLELPPTVAVPADPIKDATEKALAAYRGMWAAYQTAGQTANPDDPGLTVYATGPALETLVNGLGSIRDRGLVIKGTPILNPIPTEFSPPDMPTSMGITDCADSTNFLLYKASGELANDEPGGRRRILATVAESGGGTWKVTSFGAQAIGTC